MEYLSAIALVAAVAGSVLLWTIVIGGFHKWATTTGEFDRHDTILWWVVVIIAILATAGAVVLL